MYSKESKLETPGTRKRRSTRKAPSKSLFEIFIAIFGWKTIQDDEPTHIFTVSDRQQRPWWGVWGLPDSSYYCDTLFKLKLFLVYFILFMILAKPHGHQLQITASLRREGKGGRCRRFAERPLRCKFSDDTVLLHN